VATSVAKICLQVLLSSEITGQSFLSSIRMADPSLGYTTCTLQSMPTVAGSSSISKLGPASKSLSSNASTTARFSLDLRQLEAVNALNTLSEVSETQMLDTQLIMHELSTDSKVTLRREIGSAEILPTRPGIDPFEDTRPMPDLSCIQQLPITATSPSVIARPRTQSGPVPPSSSHFYLLTYFKIKLFTQIISTF